MAIKVRRFKMTDLNDIMRLARIARNEIKWWELETKDKFRKIHATDKNMLWVSEADGRIVGFLAGDFRICKNLTGEETRFPEIDSIYVLKEYRRKGVASKLVQAFGANLKPKYFSGKKKYLSVPAASDAGYALLKKLGFKQDVRFMRKKIKV